MSFRWTKRQCVPMKRKKNKSNYNRKYKGKKKEGKQNRVYIFSVVEYLLTSIELGYLSSVHPFCRHDMTKFKFKLKKSEKFVL